MTPQELTERRVEGLAETSQAATEPDEASPAGSQAEACASMNGDHTSLTRPEDTRATGSQAETFADEASAATNDIGPAWPLTEAQRQEWPHGWPARDEQSPPSSETDNSKCQRFTRWVQIVLLERYKLSRRQLQKIVDVLAKYEEMKRGPRKTTSCATMTEIPHSLVAEHNQQLRREMEWPAPDNSYAQCLDRGIGAYLLRGLGDYVGDNAYGQGFNLRVEPYVGSRAQNPLYMNNAPVELYRQQIVGEAQPGSSGCPQQGDGVVGHTDQDMFHAQGVHYPPPLASQSFHYPPPLASQHFHPQAAQTVHYAPIPVAQPYHPVTQNPLYGDLKGRRELIRLKLPGSAYTQFTASYKKFIAGHHLDMAEYEDMVPLLNAAKVLEDAVEEGPTKTITDGNLAEKPNEAFLNVTATMMREAKQDPKAHPWILTVGYEGIRQVFKRGNKQYCLNCMDKTKAEKYCPVQYPNPNAANLRCGCNADLARLDFWLFKATGGVEGVQIRTPGVRTPDSLPKKSNMVIHEDALTLVRAGIQEVSGLTTPRLYARREQRLASTAIWAVERLQAQLSKYPEHGAMADSLKEQLAALKNTLAPIHNSELHPEDRNTAEARPTRNTRDAGWRGRCGWRGGRRGLGGLWVELWVFNEGKLCRGLWYICTTYGGLCRGVQIVPFAIPQLVLFACPNKRRLVMGTFCTVMWPACAGWSMAHFVLVGNAWASPNTSKSAKMTEPSEVASGTKLTQGIDPWVAMLLEIRQAMLASPASSDVEAAGVDRYSYAIWKFAKHAAVFYHQAEAEGNLKEYFERIDKISRDRWPTFEEGALKKKVRSDVMAEAISTVTSIPSQHWRDVLDIDYDRVHRRNAWASRTAQNVLFAEQIVMLVAKCAICEGAVIRASRTVHFVLFALRRQGSIASTTTQRRRSGSMGNMSRLALSCILAYLGYASSAAHRCDALWAMTTSPNLRRGTVFGIAGGVVGGWRTISPTAYTAGKRAEIPSVGAAAAWTSGDVPDTLAHELHTDRREGWLDTTDSAVAAKDDGYRMRVGGCERDRRLEQQQQQQPHRHELLPTNKRRTATLTWLDWSDQYPEGADLKGQGEMLGRRFDLGVILGGGEDGDVLGGLWNAVNTPIRASFASATSSSVSASGTTLRKGVHS
ncbi:hypothetical protein BJ912DRAFT_933089 [Pholiota molesta]|nr:hypothetical protein BJ912DRAFT_933089 [Pholiota molesta]